MAIFVKSVEYVEINVLSTELTVSSSLTKGQDYRNCVPFMTSHSSNDYMDSKLFDMFFSGTYLNGIINFSRMNLRSTTATIKCYVVEFYSTEVRVQQGTFNNSTATTDTVTISTTVDSTKTGFTFGWKNSSTSLSWNSLVVRGTINDTSIIFYRNNTTGNCSGHWFLFEDLNNNFNVTHISSSYTTASQSVTIDDGRCVDPLRTFILSSYTTNNSNDDSNRQSMRVMLYTNGSLRANKYNTSYATMFWSAQVIEFLDQEKVYVPFDHFLWNSITTPIVRSVGNDTNRVPFSCNMAYSMACSAMVQGISRVDGSTPADVDECFMSVELTDANTITHTKSAASYTVYPSMSFAVDWRGISVDIGTNSSTIPEGVGSGESFVKSVENFRFDLYDFFGAKVLSKGQNWQNCVVFASTRGTGTDTPVSNTANVYLVSPGIVCFRSWTASNRVIDVSVVEFWPNQVKVQHQTRHTQRINTTTTTIEPVSDLNKCFLTSKIGLATTSTIGNKITARTRLTAVDTVEFYLNSGGAATDISFFVVEDLQDNFDTRHFLGSFSTQTYSNYDDSFNWDTENTFILSSYANSGGNDDCDRNYIRSYYVNEHRPFYTDKQNTTYPIVYIASTIVKFKKKGKHVKHINTSFSAAVHTGEYSATTSGHENALTCFNNVQSSCIRCNTNSANGISDSFATIRITDYVARRWETSKAAHSYSSWGSFTLIDWIGADYQTDNNIPAATSTRSVIKSVQTDFYDGTSSYLSIPLTKGQDIKQCVPFLSNSCSSSNFDVNRFYKAIYRYDSPDHFSVRYGASASSNRKVTTYFVEFGDNIRVQYGSGYSTDHTKTFIIDEVLLDRAFLVFYAYGDSGENFIRTHAVCGLIRSSTTLEFIRAYDGGSMFISWYVVECPDDDSYWKVQHAYETAKGGAASVNVTIPGKVDPARTLFLASWATTAANDYPSRNTYRMYFNLNNKVYFNKYDSTYYNMNNVNVEAVEFSKGLYSKGFKAHSDDVSLTTTDTVEKSLRGNSFDFSRSMVISGNQQNEGKVDVNAEQGFDEGYHHYSFKNPTTITALKSGGTSYTTSSYFFAYQWPEYNKYYMEGTVVESREQSYLPVDREVCAYRALTGELVDRTTSSGGYFFVESPYADEHYIVCRDDIAGTDYNDLIYSRIQPAVISGTFAYNEGLVTLSGMDIGIPLGRL